MRNSIKIGAAILAAGFLIAAAGIGPALIKATSIELGPAGTTDTTITRSGAGAVQVEGTQVILNAASPTFGTVTTTGNIELGNASDTTLSRGAAAEPEVEGKRIFWQCGSSVATTSGDDLELSNAIPANAKRMSVQFVGVSISGTDDINVVIGDAGGYETTGYSSIGFSNTTGVAGSAGFLINGVAASEVYRGGMELTTRDNLTWVENHTLIKDDTTDLLAIGAGSKATSQTTTTIRLSTSGSNTFDAGSAFVCWDN